MARNKFAGDCYKCGTRVEVGDGHFERHNGKFRVQHATCVTRSTTDVTEAGMNTGA